MRQAILINGNKETVSWIPGRRKFINKWITLDNGTKWFVKWMGDIDLIKGCECLQGEDNWFIFDTYPAYYSCDNCKGSGEYK